MRFTKIFLASLLSSAALSAPIPEIKTVIVTQISTIHRAVSYTVVDGVTSTVFYDMDHGSTPIPLSSPTEEPTTSTIQVFVTSTYIAESQTTAASTPDTSAIQVAAPAETTSSTTVATYSSSEVAPTATSTYVPPTTTSTYAPPTATSAYVAPTTSTYVAPTTSSTEVSPTTSSTYVAPTTTSTTSTSSAPTSTTPTSTVSTSTSTSSPTSATNSGQGTYYDTGVGACGITNTDSDFIVAISKDLFDSANVANPNDNPFCNKQITANYGGKSVTVTVTDRCVGCAMYDLDFSPAAFSSIADESLGRINIDWNWS